MRTILAFAILIAGCGPRIATAHVPGCVAEARVAVPRGCYAWPFNGFLEIRCPRGTPVKYAECR